MLFVADASISQVVYYSLLHKRKFCLRTNTNLSVSGIACKMYIIYIQKIYKYIYSYIVAICGILCENYGLANLR